jgi:outer membrane protein assembly factor BamB
MHDVGPLPWFPIDSGQGLVVGDTLLVGAADGGVRAVAKDTGKVLWRFQTGERVVARPVGVEDRVYIGSMDGHLYCLDRQTGEQRWAFDSRSAVISSATVIGGRVLFSNDRNEVYALDAETGKYLWHKRRSHRTEFTITGQGAPAVADGAAIVGYSDGALVAMALEDGATRWSVSLGATSDRFTDVDATPIVRGDVVFASSFRGGLSALDLADGTVKWTHLTEGATVPAMDDDMLYIATADREVRGLRRETGELVWRTVFTTGALSEPVLAGPWLFVSTDEQLAVLTAETGRIQEVWPLVDGISAPPFVDGRGVFVVSNRGTLHAFHWSR